MNASVRYMTGILRCLCDFVALEIIMHTSTEQRLHNILEEQSMLSLTTILGTLSG